MRFMVDGERIAVGILVFFFFFQPTTAITTFLGETQPSHAVAQVEADDTAEKLGLEDEDLIDVAMEQTGGR